MPPSTCLDVDLLFAAPGRQAPLERARVELADGTVAAVGAAPDGAGAGLMAMPALADAHDHCRGLHHIGFGARDQNFELWRAALYAQPPLDPYLNTALALGRLAQSGVGSVMHVYSSVRVDRMLEDARAIARAATDIGIRLGFVVPLRDRQTLGYGEDAELLARHDPRDHDLIRQTWLPPFPDPGTYMDLVAEVAREIEGPLVTVHYGPNSPQACTDGLLAAIGEASARDGRGVTTHLLETSVQRAWADALYPHGFVRHLADLGIVCPRFTGAHGVWLRPEDIAVLAENDAQIAVNASSNLRLRSGLAPVADYIGAGMPFSFGVDSFSIDDDEDALRELRVANWLFSPHDSPAPLTPARLFDGWHRHGFRAVTGRDGYGQIAPGAAGDFMVLSYDEMAYDVIEGMIDPLEVFLTRASQRHMRGLWVAGREVVRDGKVLGVDLAEVEREVVAQARANAGRMRALKPVTDRSQATLKAWYEDAEHTRIRGQGA